MLLKRWLYSEDQLSCSKFMSLSVFYLIANESSFLLGPLFEVISFMLFSMSVNKMLEIFKETAGILMSNT